MSDELAAHFSGHEVVTSASPSLASKQKMPLKARLIRYYQKYNPSQIPKIDHIIDLYDHDEGALFQDLFARYGPEVFDTPQVVEDSAPSLPPPPRESSVKDSTSSLVAAPEIPSAAGEASSVQPHRQLPPPLASPSQHSQSDPLATSSALVDMPDASSPYHRSESKRRFPSASAGSDPSAFSLQQQHRQGDLVYDGAFSPNRRRAPRTLGTLFSNEVGSHEPHRIDATPERRWATSDGAPLATHATGDGTAIAISAGGAASRHIATPSNTQSDTFVSDVTSVVYRRDAQLLAKESARRIVDAAKKNASVGFLANTTSLVMQRSAAAEMYAQHLETLRNPAAYSSKAIAQHIRNQRLGTTTSSTSSHHQQHDHLVVPHAEIPTTASSTKPVVIPSVRVIQSTLNIDEMSSYRALADYQKREIARLESPEALLQHPRADAHRSSTSEGGLFFESWQARPLQGKRITFEGNNGTRHLVATDAAEQARNRLRAIHTSPLVSMQRARLQAQAARNRGYANFEEAPQQHEEYEGINNNTDPHYDRDGGAFLNTSLDAAAPDNADMELQPIDMICTVCGMVCKIVPGREHEFVHEH